jgi:hypothetical protein
MEWTAGRHCLLAAFALAGLCVANAAQAQLLGSAPAAPAPSGAAPAGSRAAARGKDLRGRWGLGVANIGPSQTPTVSADWHVTQASGFSFDLGVDTSAAANLLSLAARFNRNLFIEDYMLYYLYLGGGLVSQQGSGATDSSSGYLVEAGTAAKFFLQALPNLGLSLGGGVRLESLGGVRFRTVVNGGMHYYF